MELNKINSLVELFFKKHEEIKSKTDIFYETLLNKLQSKKIRISKYCRAVYKLFNYNIQRQTN